MGTETMGAAFASRLSLGLDVGTECFTVVSDVDSLVDGVFRSQDGFLFFATLERA